jgi:hypothetical protein
LFHNVFVVELVHRCADRYELCNVRRLGNLGNEFGLGLVNILGGNESLYGNGAHHDGHILGVVESSYTLGGNEFRIHTLRLGMGSGENRLNRASLYVYESQPACARESRVRVADLGK